MSEVKYCPNCGKPFPQGARFCPYCGFSIASIGAQTATSLAETAAGARARERPLGLMIISACMFVLAVISFIAGFYYTLLGLEAHTLAREVLIPAATIREISRGGELSPLMQSLLRLWPLLYAAPSLGLFVVGFSILYVISAYGLWTMRHWAWAAAAGLLTAHIAAWMPTSTEPPTIISGIAAIVFGVASIAYLSRRNVKSLFEAVRQG